MRVALLVALTALAAPNPRGAVAAPPPTDAATAEAKVHFEAGKSYFEKERWEEAAREFDEAYRLSHLPDLLTNMARCYAHLGREEQAIAKLEEYLAARPDAFDAPSVRGEIAARRQALAERRRAEEARHEVEQERSRVAQIDAARGRTRLRWAGGGLVAGGVVAAAVGVVLGVLALHEAQVVSGGGALSPDPNASPGLGAEWRDAYNGRFADAQAAGKRDEIAGLVLDVLGGALALSGGALLLWSLRAPGGERRAVRLAPTGRGLLVVGSF